mgnify:CR=1 FL=1
MPRRAAAVRREVQPDAKYNNRLVTQLINKVLLDGKKSVAEGIVYGAFDIVAEKTGQDPIEVNSRRSTTLAIRWLVDFSRKRKENTMAQRLANEIIDASENTGAAVKKREDTYKMAEANRAFAHYRW